MPTLPSYTAETLRLFVGGMVHADWERYEIDSDLLIPADAWRVTLSTRAGNLPADVKPGAAVEIRVGDELVMVGRIDEVDDEISKSGIRFSISGRDGAAVLVDCSSPIFVAQMASLQEIVAKVVIPLGVKAPRIDAENARIREKVNVEPGESGWDTLAHAAEANGLWPWFEPDGTLVVGGPDYDKPPVAMLVMRKSGQGNNVLRLSRRASIAGRYSEVTVLGQQRGNLINQGKHGLKATERDPSVGWYRPRTIIDYEADSPAVCSSRALKLLTDSRLRGFTLQADVTGHRIDAQGWPGHGLLWKPGQRVHVLSEPQGIDGVFFLMARRFVGGRNQGARTILVLKEDRTWVLDAHPHKKKHRLGKNSAPAQILDISKGAAQ